MKKYLLIFTITVCIAHAMEDEEQQYQSEVFNQPLTLHSLCIQYILSHPRLFIEQDAEHQLNENIQDEIRKIWYLDDVKRRLKCADFFIIFDPTTDFSQGGFLSERIPLAQLLLFQASNKINNENEKLILTKQEQKIFNGMLPAQYKEIEPHIQKSIWRELYEILCT